MPPARPLRVLVHGGAGGKKPTAAQRSCLTESLISGMHILKTGGTSVDAIEAMIRLMEGSGLFNAGIGSRLQLDGIKRMDAALMEGAHLKAGAIASIRGNLTSYLSGLSCHGRNRACSTGWSSRHPICSLF